MVRTDKARVAAWLAAVLVLAATAARAARISIDGPSQGELLEKQTYPIAWRSDGIDRVSIVVYGTRTPLGTRARGRFRIQVAERSPASDGKVDWTVPWIDSVGMTIKAVGIDASGKPAAVAEKTYGFRPAVMEKRSKDGLYLDLHKRTDQRLYVQKDGKLVRAYISSSSEAYKWLPLNEHVAGPHDHAGVFRVLDKSLLHESKLFNVPMRYAMRYNGGHFIHATSRNLYRYLGRAASHGCNRLTLFDARQLYDSTPVGTRVEVIGPEG